jgi:ABC-type uncharacterized transport system involved in gliding motility auxiliary subunit
MGSILRYRSGALLLGIFAAGLFIVLNLGVSALTGVRIDLTQDKLFTLSEGTKNILKSMNKPATMTLYYSRELGEAAPPLGVHATRVRDILKEFAAASAGNLTVLEKEPEPFSETEDIVVKAGLQGLPLDESGDKVYFGLIGEQGDAKGVIPMFQLERDRFLEYDLARMVAKLQNPDPARIGIWTSAPMFGDVTARMRGMPSQPWAVVSNMQQNFAVRQIVLPEQLGEDVDLLILAHATGLEDEELYAIDQYLMRGGKAIIFVDPYSEGAGSRRMTMGATPTASDLKKLLGSWGVDITEGKIAGDRSLARLVNAGTQQQLIPAPYITWLQLGAANISRSDLVTSNLNRVNLASAGSITLKKDAQLNGEPLFWTTPESQLVDVKYVSGQRPDIQGMVERFEPSGKKKILAMRLSGAVKSAFPNGAPISKDAENQGEQNIDKSNELQKASGTAAGEAKPKLKPHVAESQVPLNLILVADTDLLSNPFWVQAREFFGRRFSVPVANNGDFVLNAVENLSGTSDLIGLRSRGTARRPFTKIEAMAKTAQQQFQAEEQRLMRQLEETEKKILSLQGGAKGPAQADAVAQSKLTPDQEAEIKKFTDEMLATRRALRQVRHNLKKDIEGLRNRLSFLNIALVPILVTVAAGSLGAARMRRRRRSFIATE